MSVDWNYRENLRRENESSWAFWSGFLFLILLILAAVSITGWAIDLFDWIREL